MLSVNSRAVGLSGTAFGGRLGGGVGAVGPASSACPSIAMAHRLISGPSGTGIRPCHRACRHSLSSWPPSPPHWPLSPPGAARPCLPERGAAVLCPDRAEGGAGGGQCLRRPHGGEPQSAAGRSLLPPLLRRAGRWPERAAAALARLRRAGRRIRPRGHQQPRHRRCRPGEGFARRQARVRSRDRAEGFSLRPRGAADQG